MSREHSYLEFRFDDKRIERALALEVYSVDYEGQELPKGHYMVAGGSQPHFCVTVSGVDCDCQDFIWGDNRLCKHLIAALIQEKDPLILGVL
jgi:hypothetical protein